MDFYTGNENVPAFPSRNTAFPERGTPVTMRSTRAGKPPGRRCRAHPPAALLLLTCAGAAAA